MTENTMKTPHGPRPETLMHKNLRWLLDQRDRSARDVSLAAGLSKNTIFEILDHPTRHPRVDTVKAIAGALGITTLQLIDLDLERVSGLGQFDPATGGHTPESHREIQRQMVNCVDDTLFVASVTNVVSCVLEESLDIDPVEIAAAALHIYRQEVDRTADPDADGGETEDRRNQRLIEQSRNILRFAAAKRS